MVRDKLILLNADFEDPAFPGQRFYCWHCALLEGLLASYPEMRNQIDVERIDWARPRQRLVDLLGSANQSLPVMILGDDAMLELKVREANGRRFIDDKDDILAALALRHGMAIAHP